MNKLKYIIIFLGLTVFSCNEENWLEEKPYSIYSPENSYETNSNFKQALNYIYDLIRLWHFTYSDETGGYQHHLFIGSDVFYHGWPADLENSINRYDTYINSTRNHVQKNWSMFYSAISKANDILAMLETNASKVSAADKRTFRGEALFFRAYHYRMLAHIYGDVPIITEMLTVQKNDFTRSPRAEVYKLCQEDLEEAVRLLDDIDKVDDGRVNKQVAQHILAEVYISQGNYSKAIEAASAVTDHPATGLMTERFGTTKDAPGDVFYDLFRFGNQNRSKGNTEGLYVIQYDYNNGSPVARNLGRYIMPQLRTAMVAGKNAQGQSVNVPPCPDFNAEDGGRGNGYFPTTHHFRVGVWASDFNNDIRNSEYNIFRDYRIDNVLADGHGQWIVKDGWLRDVDTFTYLYPAVTKFCAFDAYPDNSYAMSNGVRRTTSLGKHILISSGTLAIGSYKDEYLIRLSETYLLLAEAYLLNGQKDKAAEAINVVRSRAKASLATADQMDIDYILDERIRELAGEEVRNITLFRMGQFVRRAKMYSPNKGKYVGDWQNFWPIPFSETERNTGAILTQNPGYGGEQ